jgi:hypothetical protein
MDFERAETAYLLLSLPKKKTKTNTLPFAGNPQFPDPVTA